MTFYRYSKTEYHKLLVDHHLVVIWHLLANRITVLCKLEKRHRKTMSDIQQINLSRTLLCVRAPPLADNRATGASSPHFLQLQSIWTAGAEGQVLSICFNRWIIRWITVVPLPLKKADMRDLSWQQEFELCIQNPKSKSHDSHGIEIWQRCG